MVSTVHGASPVDNTESDRLGQLVGQLPWRVTTKKDVNADLLNLVFLGSEDQVKSALREAGWHNADPVSRHTYLKNFFALLNNSGYAEEPMMTFFLNGKPEDMNWQKGLNSYGRRDYVRIWQWTSEESDEQVWISSSTHDTGAVLSVKHKAFVHHISPDIDDERCTVIRNLNFAGCVKSVNYVSNPEMPASTHNATGDIMVTDKSVAVIALQDCRPPDPQLDSNSKGGSFKLGIRRQILTVRNDIWRANIIYRVYEAGRMAVGALRHPPATQGQLSAMDAGSKAPSSAAAISR
jgi:hypothetical protein